MIERPDLCNEFKSNYLNNSDLCKSILLMIIIEYNYKISSGEAKNHDFKHMMFKTECIKNPMGGKYSEDDYKKTLSIMLYAINMIKAINDPTVDTSAIVVPSLKIDQTLYRDCIDILMYTDILFNMNKINTKRMDDSDFSNQPFIEQLLTHLVFFQDQYRLAKIDYVTNSEHDTLTGMELFISNKSASYSSDIKSSVNDSFEGSAEAIDEIIRFLYYKNKENLVDHIDVDTLNRIDLNPYENASFELNTRIAFQRHFLQRMEETIRCGFLMFNSVVTTENDTKVYMFSIQSPNKTKARYSGLFRREYQIRSITVTDTFAQKSYAESVDIIKKLSEKLIELQCKDFVSFDLSSFHLNKNEYLSAENIENIKKHIIKCTTKNYYLISTVMGIKIQDYLTCYFFLDTLASILYAASLEYSYETTENSLWKEICIIDINYLVRELSRIHDFDLEYSAKLIDRFIYHHKNNRGEDIFAQPLITVSQEQIAFCPALIDQVNLDRAIERQFIRYDKDKSKIGLDFEEGFINTLKKGYKSSLLDSKYHIIPNYHLNTNKIQYVAFDGKDIEFDVVSMIGNCLILTELKAMMTSYDYTDMIERERNIKKAVNQLKRRKESVIKDWDTFRKKISFQLPDKPIGNDQIILVACSDAYDFTPLQYDDVFITDDSTYLKYFTNPYIDLFEFSKQEFKIKQAPPLWHKNRPTASNFINYLKNPSTTTYIHSMLKINQIQMPYFDYNDYGIVIEECQLNEDPIKKQAESIEVLKKRVSKNAHCPCGSGRKFRNCCKGKGIYD